VRPNANATILGLVVGALFAGACGGAAPEATRAAADEGASPSAGATPPVSVTPVVSRTLTRELRLPGELEPYQDVQLHARVQGFVESMTVDVGSRVRRGDIIATIVAPELSAQRSEAEARVQSAMSQRLETDAQLAAADATYTRLKAASATEGVVAGHELELAEKAMEGSRARVQVAMQSVEAAEQTAASLRAMEAYLRITSPFDGVVTERQAHVGSLVGPSTPPLVRLQQTSRLRLAIAIPEVDIGGIQADSTVTFSVPAFPDRTFSGRVTRIARALDPATRSMLVEADVDNQDGTLAPGMFAELQWVSRRPEPSLFVPATAVVTTTERTFVVRVRDGRVDWVNVRRGAPMGNLIEVFGALASGDRVAVRGTDELRPDSQVAAVEADARL